jgi:photosystem II cytochrome c550
MCRHFSWLLSLGVALALWVAMTIVSPPVYAADPYITRILQIHEPIPLALDQAGKTRLFSPDDLSRGKELFAQNCIICHVGGATLPNPTASLTLAALKAATPPHDTIDSLVAYMRQPLSYDGTEESYLCRKVSASWLAQAEVEDLAGFILIAAQKAPTWGQDRFQ